jgi:hypothetical protein
MVRYDNIREQQVIDINSECCDIVRERTKIPLELQDVLLELVGCFHECGSNIDDIFREAGIRGYLDFGEGKFSFYSGFRPDIVIDNEGPDWAPTGESMGLFKDTVVYVGDVFYYKPFSNERLNESSLICEFRSPRGDGTLTAGEILDNLFECEKEHRPSTHWIDGPDYSHIQFEGFFDHEFDEPEWIEKYVWEAFWGS